MWIWWQCWRQINIGTSFIAQFATPKSWDVTKTRFHIEVKWLRQKKWKMVFLRGPAQFWELRSEILRSYLNRMCTQREGRYFSFFPFFNASYGRFCISWIFMSAVSLGQKKEGKRPALLLFICASTSCKKIKINYIVLSGARPTCLFGSDLADPARTVRRMLTP